MHFLRIRALCWTVLAGIVVHSATSSVVPQDIFRFMPHPYRCGPYLGAPMFPFERATSSTEAPLLNPWKTRCIISSANLNVFCHAISNSLPDPWLKMKVSAATATESFIVCDPVENGKCAPLDLSHLQDCGHPAADAIDFEAIFRETNQAMINVGTKGTFRYKYCGVVSGSKDERTVHMLTLANWGMPCPSTSTHADTKHIEVASEESFNPIERPSTPGLPPMMTTSISREMDIQRRRQQAEQQLRVRMQALTISMQAAQARKEQRQRLASAQVQKCNRLGFSISATFPASTMYSGACLASLQSFFNACAKSPVLPPGWVPEKFGEGIVLYNGEKGWKVEDVMEECEELKQGGKALRALQSAAPKQSLLVCETRLWTEQWLFPFSQRQSCK